MERAEIISQITAILEDVAEVSPEDGPAAVLSWTI